MALKEIELFNGMNLTKYQFHLLIFSNSYFVVPTIIGGKLQNEIPKGTKKSHQASSFNLKKYLDFPDLIRQHFDQYSLLFNCI